MDSGSIPVDLILFAMIAAFLVLRLRSILGRRTGFERPAAPVAPGGIGAPVIEARAEPVAVPRTAHILPDPTSEPGSTLLAMRKLGEFDPDRFLTGAGQAFGMIVNAFALGDRAALQPLLNTEMFAAFCDAINGRMERGETQISQLRDISELRIVGAVLTGSVAAITVRIVSDQISMIIDANKEPIHGTDAVTELADLWTFERDLTSPDPTWRLTGARSA